MGKTITTLEMLKNASKGDIVELPRFSEKQEFVARIKRPSMLKMIESGVIPNTLLTKANDMFMTKGQGLDPEEENSLKDVLKILESIAERSFIEPTFEELKEAGIELTDEQLMFLFRYSQEGVHALESFRTE